MCKKHHSVRSLIIVIIAWAVGMTSAIPLRAQTTPCKPVMELELQKTGIAVAQICQHDESLNKITNVSITDPSGRIDPSASLVRNQIVAPRTSLIAPAATYLDLLGTTFRMRARYGVRTTILDPNVGGSAVHLGGLGGALFVVQQHVLNLFRVDVDTRFIAAVPGTTFDVDLADPSSVVFSVSDGRVAVTRLVSVHLDREGRDVDRIRVTEYIDAGARSVVTYARAAELWQHFANTAEARQRFNRDLESARAATDSLLEGDARWNLRRLDIALDSGHRNNIFTKIAAAAATFSIILITSNSKRSPATPQIPTVTPIPGKVTIRGVRL